jgi:hypothetical protein
LLICPFPEEANTEWAFIRKLLHYRPVIVTYDNAVRTLRTFGIENSSRVVLSNLFTRKRGVTWSKKWKEKVLSQPTGISVLWQRSCSVTQKNMPVMCGAFTTCDCLTQTKATKKSAHSAWTIHI